jgi:membrane associated rhomboid family serine protease
MGAYFVMYPHSRIVTLVPFLFLQIIEVPAVFFLGIWFLMQFLSGVGSIAQVEAGTGGVAFWAHVAGFAVGVLGACCSAGRSVSASNMARPVVGSGGLQPRL